MFKSECPTVKITNDQMILSLPDAMTPVVWMMDVNEIGTFVLKVEQNEYGQYILQKISNNGQKIEEIAYYSSRSKAIKAMTLITKTKGDHKCSPSKFCSILSFLNSLIVFLAALCILFVFSELFLDDIYDVVFGNSTVQDVQVVQQQAPQQPIVETNPNAVGVPMSADDFLNQNSNSGFPF